jgi:hypothetical protein
VRFRSQGQGIRKHLDGWQAGAVLLLIAGSAILLAVPRAVAPEALPEPRIDFAELSKTLTADHQRVTTAAQTPLDVDVRAVGSQLRHYNLTARTGDARALFDARTKLLASVGKALPRGNQPLLSLRAVQTQLFVDAVHAWSRTGEVSDDLIGLGGDFLATVRRSGWCREGSRELLASDAELRVLFKTRWSDLTGLDAAVFSLSLDEDRLRYRFLLRHPLARHDEVAWPHSDPAVINTRNNRARLKLVDRLERLDPSYPGELARGVLSFWLGQPERAAEHFRHHLERQPDGPYTLRAQNYLKAALDHTLEPR